MSFRSQRPHRPKLKIHRADYRSDLRLLEPQQDDPYRHGLYLASFVAGALVVAAVFVLWAVWR